MEKFSLIVFACALVGCAGAAPSDEEVVERSAEMWSERYGWTDRCEGLLQHVTVEYGAVAPGCAAPATACAHPDGRIVLHQSSRLSDRARIQRLVHETTHLWLLCADRGAGIDANHSNEVWSTWTPEVTRALLD